MDPLADAGIVRRSQSRETQRASLGTGVGQERVQSAALLCSRRCEGRAERVTLFCFLLLCQMECDLSRGNVITPKRAIRYTGERPTKRLDITGGVFAGDGAEVGCQKLCEG